ncbi:uncharacterized protein LOC121340521 [Onychostruthus taczanowskii]|uniref:uncharacterized protein LOC121340521 n=1 Tax=Onychostruthus taczanowskii TaxID=356909 RepID=UPI001B805CD3|nr:uncharacterized protein LOC121340521 [Onychostruthus taczanowskii]
MAARAPSPRHSAPCRRGAITASAPAGRARNCTAGKALRPGEVPPTGTAWPPAKALSVQSLPPRLPQPPPRRTAPRCFPALFAQQSQNPPRPTSAAACGGSGRARGVRPGAERERRRPEPGGGSGPGCHQRACEAVPEAELPKDLSALLMSREQGAVYSRKRDAGCELEESELCSIGGVVNEALDKRSETGNTCRRSLGQWIRSHPVGTVVLILLLLVLLLALGVALAVQSAAAAAAQVPVTPVTPLLVLGCPRLISKL